MTKQKTKRAGSKTSSKKPYLNPDFKFLLYCLSVILILFLSLLNISRLGKNRPTNKVLGTKDLSLEEKEYYLRIISQFPTYKDGWLKLALIEHKLGNKYQAQKALNVAKKIDPNSEKIKVLEKQLGF